MIDGLKQEARPDEIEAVLEVLTATSIKEGEYDEHFVRSATSTAWLLDHRSISTVTAIFSAVPLITSPVRHRT